jgi:hypothetical protein
MRVCYEDCRRVALRPWRERVIRSNPEIVSLADCSVLEDGGIEVDCLFRLVVEAQTWCDLSSHLSMGAQRSDGGRSGLAPRWGRTMTWGQNVCCR